MTTNGTGRTGPALSLWDVPRDDSRTGVAATASQVRSHPHPHHEPVRSVMKDGERWVMCRTCGAMLEVRRAHAA